MCVSVCVDTNLVHCAVHRKVFTYSPYNNFRCRTDFNYAVTILSLIGKALIAVPFATVYVHAAEVFPTEVRMIGMGTGVTFACFASMTSSFVGGPLVCIPRAL